MRCKPRFLALVLMLMLTLLPAAVAEEQPRLSVQVEADLGYDGLLTYGKPMPLWVRLTNTGADTYATVSVKVFVSRENYNLYEAETYLTSGAVKDIMIPISIGMKQDSFTVTVQHGDTLLGSTEAVPAQVLNPSALLVGVLSDTPKDLAYMNIDANSDELMRSEFMQIVPLTVESFPTTAELLGSFGVLAVDGFDMNLLSSKQKQALDTWLEQGHILIIGGGAKAQITWPYFADLTGLTPGAVTTAEDVTPALLQWLDVAGATAGKEITLIYGQGENLLAGTPEIPLLWCSEGNSPIYTTAFSLSDPALTSWSGMHSFWQRVMMKDCYDLYQRLLYSSGSQEANYTYESSRMTLQNDVPLLQTVLLAAAILVVGTAAAYVGLKRLDKRQWLWLVLPVLTVAAVLAVGFMTAGSPGTKPVALTLAVLQQDEDGAAELNTAMTVAVPSRGEQLLTLEGGSLQPSAIDGYHDYGNESVPMPAQLLYRFIQGETKRLGVNVDTPWDAKRFLVRDVPVPEGKVEASVRLEADGLHGSITNGTELTLQEGVFLCKFGFCAIPQLAPGETHPFSMVKASFPVGQEGCYENGKMYEAMLGETVSSYSLLSRYYMHKLGLAKDDFAYGSPEQQMIELMNAVIDRTYRTSGYQYYYDYNATKFHYITLAEGMNLPQLTVNGEKVERTADRVLVNVTVPFVSADARQVLCFPGNVQAQRCQVDAWGVPQAASAQKNNRGYHQLNENPTFVFQVGEADMTIEKLKFFIDYMPNSTQLYLFNGTDWVSCTTNVEVADPQQYMDEQGCIFLQARDNLHADYSDIPTPSMYLEGRLNDHAEN